MNRLRRRLVTTERDAGLSLVELLVAMSITALAMAMVGVFFINVARTTVNGRGDRQATGAAGNAMDEISRVIRVAADIPQAGDPLPAVDTASTATSLTVYAYVDIDSANTDPPPTKVQFSVDAASNVIERRTTGVLSGKYWTFTGAVVTRTLSGPLSLGFVYWADPADPAATRTQVLPTTTTSALSVTTVAVTVTAPRKAWRAAVPVVVATTVQMPNVKIS